MSNIIKLDCQFTDVEEEFLQETLKRMKFYADKDEHFLSSHFSQKKQPCDALIRCAMTGRAIGLGIVFGQPKVVQGVVTRNMKIIGEVFDGEYVSSTDFMNRFTQEYNCVKIIRSVSELGFTVDVEETLHNGQKRLVVSRVA